MASRAKSEPLAAPMAPPPGAPRVPARGMPPSERRDDHPETMGARIGFGIPIGFVAAASAGMVGGLGSFVRRIMGRDESAPHAEPAASVARPKVKPAAPVARPDVEPEPPETAPLAREKKKQESLKDRAATQEPKTGPNDYDPEEVRWAKGRPIGEIDLVFLIDETGSMGRYISEVQRRLLDLIDAVQAATLCKSLRIGLVSYRDHPPQDTTFVSRVVPLTDDIDTIRAGVRRMEADGGGDAPEALTDGLYDVARLAWRPRAARVVVLVGDAPPHGVADGSDAFPQGCPCGHHWFTQAENCREMGVVVHAVACNPNEIVREVFQTIARTTHGLYLPLSQASLLIPFITGVAENELDKQRIMERIAEVLREWHDELAKGDDQERVRFVTEVLGQRSVRPRRVAPAPSDGEFPPLFRDITPDDVMEGLEQLRRLGETQL